MTIESIIKDAVSEAIRPLNDKLNRLLDIKQSQVDYVTINEAKKIAGLSHSALYERIKKGLISKYKDGSKTLLIRSEVEALKKKVN